MRDQASEWVMRTLDRRVAARKRQSTTRPRKLSDRARSGAVWAAGWGCCPNARWGSFVGGGMPLRSQRAPHPDSPRGSRHADRWLRDRGEQRLATPGGFRPAVRRALVHPGLDAAPRYKDSRDAGSCGARRVRPHAPACTGDRSLALSAARRGGDGSRRLESGRRPTYSIPSPSPGTPALNVRVRTKQWLASLRAIVGIGP